MDEIGQYSIENLTFKEARRQGIIQKLYNRLKELKDKDLSVQEKEKKQQTKKSDKKQQKEKNDD